MKTICYLQGRNIIHNLKYYFINVLPHIPHFIYWQDNVNIYKVGVKIDLRIREVQKTEASKIVPELISSSQSQSILLLHSNLLHITYLLWCTSSGLTDTDRHRQIQLLGWAFVDVATFVLLHITFYFYLL